MLLQLVNHFFMKLFMNESARLSLKMQFNVLILLMNPIHSIRLNMISMCFCQALFIYHKGNFLLALRCLNGILFSRYVSMLIYCDELNTNNCTISCIMQECFVWVSFIFHNVCKHLLYFITFAMLCFIIMIFVLYIKIY